DYRTAANQGDYLIITHPSLQAPYSGANQVDQYRVYRSSAAGGSYNAKVYDIDQLIDQFGYGIKKNPLGIKNFLRYARNTFSVAPKFAFLVGRGLTYSDYKENENNPAADRLDLVPTFGYPASDILLASNNLDPVMSTLISRISVLYPKELAEYLNKVRQYEQAQQNTAQTLESKGWMKNVVHVVGANDAGLDQSLSAYMKNYQNIIEDTLFGGKVTNFNKASTGPVTPIVNSLMSKLFQDGISILSYFGHSSASSLDYNLDDPAAYNNTGKYPMFNVSGCNAGDLFSFDTSRFSFLGTLSERFVLANNKGAIGFIASTHFGIDVYLDYYNRYLYKSISTTGYGKSITYNISEAINAVNSYFGTESLGGRLHAEENTLHGDPAIKINSFPKPDFLVEDPMVQTVPNIISVADTKFKVKVQLYNIGRATGDSVTVQIRHRYPDGSD
ncbi:MAG: C25 family cysteine peptidase, partial [Segetibacter sp.]